MRANPQAPRSSFLSLLDWKTRWIDSDRRQPLHAVSVSEVMALDAAVDELVDLGGIEASIARHARASRATRDGVRAMGLDLWAKDERDAANCTTAVRCPAGVAADRLVAHIRERHGVMLSLGRGSLADKLICLGHMGLAARSAYPQIAVTALGRGLADLGVAVDVGAGAEAVADAMAKPLAERDAG
jgi:pyridoxamine--pyruvate transaminase